MGCKLTTVKCLVCGKVVERYIPPSNFKVNNAGKYCSKACQLKRNSFFVKCEYCSKTFRLSPSRIRRGAKFCSKKCYGLGKRGKKHQCWRGGHNEILRRKLRCLFEYREWRNGVFENDNYTCHDCGAHGVYLEAHHTISIKSIFAKHTIRTIEEALRCSELWDVANGISLCKGCHKSIHSKRREYVRL